MTAAVGVVGAGIAGCTLAWRLAHAGRPVWLIDPAPGSGASGNAWALLHAPTGKGLENDLLRAATALAYARLEQLDLPAAALVREAHGRITAVAPPALLAQLLATAGPSLRQIRAPVSTIQWEPPHWRIGLGNAQADLLCGNLVLANGLQAGDLWPPLKSLLAPVRGQVDQFTCTLQTSPQVRRSADGYAVCGQDRAWLAGASFQPDRRDLDCDPLDSLANRARLAALLQQPADGLDHRGGRAALRVVSLDRRPLIGAAPAQAGGWKRDGWPRTEAGLWLDLAHGAHGFSSAFWAAELLAGQLGVAAPALPAQLTRACNPGRFDRR